MPQYGVVLWLSLFLTTTPLFAETLTGRIIGVTDGDTLTLLDAAHIPQKIRLSGIDAPEKRQAFGEKSKTYLSALAYNRQAQADCRKIDRYRRRVCVIYVNGRDVGREQIEAGMAWWYQQYARDQKKQERVDYEHAEFQAKRHRYGLWSSKNPTPPWEWRRGRRRP